MWTKMHGGCDGTTKDAVGAVGAAGAAGAVVGARSGGILEWVVVCAQLGGGGGG